MAYNPNEIPCLADECDVLGYPLFPGTVKSVVPMKIVVECVEKYDNDFDQSIELAEANIIDRYRADRAVAAAVVHLTKIWLADLHDAEITEVTPRPRDPATP